MRAHVRVYGKVQGVFYRASAQAEARRLGLSGWVRNREDGSVELVAEGPSTSVRHLLDWCHQGPPMARVDTVEVVESERIGLQGGFDVRPST